LDTVILVNEAGPGVAAAHSSRGCAFGDFDNDGDLDILVLKLRNDLNGKQTGSRSNCGV